MVTTLIILCVLLLVACVSILCGRYDDRDQFTDTLSDRLRWHQLDRRLAGDDLTAVAEHLTGLYAAIYEQRKKSRAGQLQMGAWLTEIDKVIGQAQAQAASFRQAPPELGLVD